MDILVEAPNHEHFDRLDQHYRSSLSKRFDVFEFIKAIKVKVSRENGISSVKLLIDMEREPIAFVEASDISEDKAFKSTILKTDQLVRKYKSKHYHGI